MNYRNFINIILFLLVLNKGLFLRIKLIFNIVLLVLLLKKSIQVFLPGKVHCHNFENHKNVVWQWFNKVLSFLLHRKPAYSPVFILSPINPSCSYAAVSHSCKQNHIFQFEKWQSRKNILSLFWCCVL